MKKSLYLLQSLNPSICVTCILILGIVPDVLFIAIYSFVFKVYYIPTFTCKAVLCISLLISFFSCFSFFFLVQSVSGFFFSCILIVAHVNQSLIAITPTPLMMKFYSFSFCISKINLIVLIYWTVLYSPYLPYLQHVPFI